MDLYKLMGDKVYQQRSYFILALLRSRNFPETYKLLYRRPNLLLGFVIL